MAEIKSTMDIIMEKTRHMTMSDDEKKEIGRRELEGKVKGLLLKFLENILSEDSFRIEMSMLKKDYPDIYKQTVMNELIQKIRLGEDNEKILITLGIACELDVSKIRRSVEVYNRDIEIKRGEFEKARISILKEKGISGSAVIPNMEADPAWLSYISDKQSELSGHLKLEFRSLTS